MTKRLLLLNGLAVIGAVLNHAAGWGFTSLFWWTDRYQSVAVPDFSQIGSATYYGLRAVEQLVTCSVPAFLFVSGFFVAFAAGREGQGLTWRRIVGRLRMLLIPYALWSIAIFVGRALDGSPSSSTSYVGQLLLGQAAEPYYYIPLLTQLYLLAPWLLPSLKKHGRAVLLAAAAVQLAVLFVRYPVLVGWDAPAAAWIWRHTPGWLFPHMVFWFVLGAFASLHLEDLKTWLARWKPVLPWATVALGVLAFMEWEFIFRVSGRDWIAPRPTALDGLYSGAFILTFVAFAESSMPRNRALNAVGERSFGVYLIHAPVLELLSRASYHAVPVILSYQFLFQPLLVAVGLAVPLLLMAAVNRSPVKAYYNYLFG